MIAAGELLGWLFVQPATLPPHMRLWMLLPLVACVALVYRATRARDLRGLVRPTALTFVNILVGMVVIAVAFYAVHMAAIRMWGRD